MIKYVSKQNKIIINKKLKHWFSIIYITDTNNYDYLIIIYTYVHSIYIVINHFPLKPLTITILI